MTIVLEVDPKNPDPEVIQLAAEAILRGQLVAFPTETVYGLGSNAMDENSVKRVYEVKGRPDVDPLIVHLASGDDLERVVIQVTGLAKKLAEVFWPGALTLVQWKRPEMPMMVTSGLQTVAVRVPAHPVALALLRAAGVPIAAPSANLFGRSSPTTAEHVLNDLGGHIDVVLDGGPATIGVESTVLDITSNPPVILRPGGVSREELEELIGPLRLSGEMLPVSNSLPSPGMFTKHYAPCTELVVCTGANPDEVLSKMKQITLRCLAEGQQVGLLIADDDIDWFSGLNTQVFLLGSQNDMEQVARRLYAGLRTLDERGVDLILTRFFDERGLGLAIRDRLRRAASRIE